MSEDDLGGDPIGDMFEDDPECDPVGDSVIIDSLESISSTVESRVRLDGDVGPEGVLVGDEAETPDDSVALLDSVLMVFVLYTFSSHFSLAFFNSVI